MPTAPEILPTLTSPRTRRTRSMLRSISAYQSASLRPKVIGSAWTPCVRPIIGVCLCSSARARTASREPLEIGEDHVARVAHLQRLRGIDDVRRGEPEVEPSGGGPDLLGDRGGERDDVVLGRRLDLLDARDVEPAPRADVGGRVGGDQAGSGHRLSRRGLDRQPRVVAPLSVQMRPISGWV